MAHSNGTKRIALTGGIGSGKSTALVMFAARGAATLSSDMLVHQLLLRKDVRAQVADRLGLGRLESGEEGRERLADIVFGDEDKLRLLESVLFPLVRKRIEDWLNSNEVADRPAAVVEIPMLFESGMEDLFDAVVLVTAPRALRQQRQSGRVGHADFERRAGWQMPEDEKEHRSDFVFVNIGSPEQLDAFVEEVLTKLRVAPAR